MVSESSMKTKEMKAALAVAVRAARAAGKLMRQNLCKAKVVNATTAYDIKLELDVRCQKLIEKILRAAFPKIALLGEEGDSGDVNATQRWVVDPIDGTVNYAHGIPHAAVSIALEIRSDADTDAFKAVVGVIYDPFQDELWTAIRGEPARCNGRVIHVSKRMKTSEAIVAIGFAKSKDNLRKSLPYFGRLARRVRKVRILGSAALSLTYVAMGRFDGFYEYGLHNWDIAAGSLLIREAGGRVELTPLGEYEWDVRVDNGRIWS